MAALYSSTQNNVVVLTQDDFISKGGVNKIKAGKFQYPGLLQVYATWCGHCQSKAPYVNTLASSMRDQDVKLSIYVLESSEENADICQLLGVEYLPSFYLVGVDRQVDSTRLEIKGNPAIKDQLATYWDQLYKGGSMTGGSRTGGSRTPLKPPRRN